MSMLMLPALLADRHRRPRALLLRFGPGGADRLPLLADHPDFLLLASQLPCFLDADTLAAWPAELAQAFTTAGCRPLAGPQCLRVDGRLPAAGEPGPDQWLAGDWYLTPPATPPGAPQAASRALSLQLVQLVANDAETREIEDVLRRDPTLSYQLLRLVNSLAMGGGNRQITSFAQAILMLGRQQLRRWLNLMLFSARADDERSALRLAHVAARARTLELLARARGLDKSDQEQAFMAGMFSLLGVLFGAPLDEVLRPLSLGPALREALVEQGGELGQLLALAERAEAGDFAAVAPRLEALALSAFDFNVLLTQAHLWMLEVARDGQGGAHG